MASEENLPASVGLHTLRHSAASTMLAAGVPLKVVSDVLGHSSVNITGDVYGHVAPEVAADAREAGDRIRLRKVVGKGGGRPDEPGAERPGTRDFRVLPGLFSVGLTGFEPATP